MATAKRKLPIPELVAMKSRGERIVMVTAYDAPSARLADDAGIDIILVGALQAIGDPHERLKEVRATLPSGLSRNDALGIALMATAEFRALDPDEKDAIWRNSLETYVVWKMANDDDFWKALDQAA